MKSYLCRTSQHRVFLSSALLSRSSCRACRVANSFLRTSARHLAVLSFSPAPSFLLLATSLRFWIWQQAQQAQIARATPESPKTTGWPTSTVVSIVVLTHCVPFSPSSRCVPRGHVLQIVDPVFPATANDPSGQVMHAAEPLCGLYFPATHGVQRIFSSTSTDVYPALH